MLVYSEHRIFPDAQARIAELELTLAQARAFVVDRADHPSVTDGFQEFAQGVLTRIDKALDGTLHSFNSKEANR